MIGLCVDSNSQLPDSLAQRFGIAVVPLTVTIDDVDHLEGIDITVDEFYAAWADGHTPIISTGHPSPGRILETYRRLADGGADEIVSIHVAAAMSGTHNAARLAAELSPVPVTVVDSGTASFGISCCAWAAALAIDDGASSEVVAGIVADRSAALGSTFIVGVPALTERSGRAVGAGTEAAAVHGVPVLSMSGSDIAVLDTVTTIDAAVSVMARYALDWPASSAEGVRVAIGTSDDSSSLIGAALDDALRGHPLLAEPPVHYRIGPSIGAHTGPGTAGLFVF